MGPPEIQFITSTSPNDVGLVEAEGAGGSEERRGLVGRPVRHPSEGVINLMNCGGVLTNADPASDPAVSQHRCGCLVSTFHAGLLAIL